jgi:hypothetical protein
MGEWLKPAVLKIDFTLPFRLHNPNQVPLSASNWLHIAETVSSKQKLGSLYKIAPAVLLLVVLSRLSLWPQFESAKLGCIVLLNVRI